MVSTSKRCQCRNISNNLICKNKSLNTIIFNNIRHCNFHFQYYAYKFALTIQRYYRGYKQRKLLNNIYRRLPDDIQRKIIYFVRQDHYYKRYTETLSKILRKKLFKQPCFRYYYNIDIACVALNINTIEACAYIYKKYKTILPQYLCYNLEEMTRRAMLELEIHGYKNFENRYTDPILNNSIINTLYYRLDYYLNDTTKLSSCS